MDAVEEIKSRLSVEDVVGDYIELKRAGRNFRGLSPFSGEKTPSFMVSPEKQIWHDFSSGKGGNIFSFVMEMEGVEFRGALEILARKAGVDLAPYGNNDSDYKKKKDQTLEAIELATKYYQQTILKNEEALNYVTKTRKFNKQTMGDFRIGYSPNAGTALIDFLKKRGISEESIKNAGLGVFRYNGLGDMFRGRVMIPLTDVQGLPIGFTARILTADENAPKYINTPAIIVYDKSRHVFGLNLAKDAIRQAGFVVIVEGNLDVIASHQAGVNNVVATAGTALTTAQLKILQRFTSDIRLCFDQDKAGISAAERSIAVAQGVGVQLSIIEIIGAKDPDELIKKDVQAWQKAVGRPIYAIDWLIDKYKKQFDITSANGKKQFTDVLLATINHLEDKVEQDHYLLKLAKLIGVSESAIRQKQAQIGKTDNKKLRKPKQPEEILHKADEYMYEDQLLCLLVNPTTRRSLEYGTGRLVFHTPERQRVYEYLESNPQARLDPDIPEDLKDVEDYVKILVFKAEEHYSKFDANKRLRELSDLISKLTKDNKKEKKCLLDEKLALAEKNGDEVERDKVTEQIRDLIKEGQ